MKKVKHMVVASLLLGSTFLGMSSQAYADAAEGDVIMILGEDLSSTQKQSVLGELTPPDNVMNVTVTNAEEHKYLGSYISKAQIGSKALSSAKITIGKKDSGLIVSTNHINWVTNDMYTNALITAGVKDAKIDITAPFDVSGTAALTGLIKAYEVSTGEKIPEEQKQVANEEMVKTAQLGDTLGKEQANALMTNVKEEIAKQKPETKEEMKTLIQGVATGMNIEVPEAQLNGLVDFFMKMKDLNIDWNAMGDQLDKAKEKFTNFIESEEAKNVIDKIKDFFTGLVDIVKGWFTKEDPTN